MTSFQAKIRGQTLRKGENSIPTWRVIENSKKKEKNLKKFKKYNSGFISSQNIRRNCKKIQKIKKIQLWLLFKQKLAGKGREREKIQISVSFRSNPMHYRKFQTNSKKIQKIVKYYYGFISSQNKGGNAEKGRK